jgi:hypothetical protein
VLVPDFFNGNGLSLDVVPTDTEEKKKHAQKIFASAANREANLLKLLAIRKEIIARFPAAKNHRGVFGLCWAVSWRY